MRVSVRCYDDACTGFNCLFVKKIMVGFFPACQVFCFYLFSGEGGEGDRGKESYIQNSVPLFFYALSSSSFFSFSSFVISSQSSSSSSSSSSSYSSHSSSSLLLLVFHRRRPLSRFRPFLIPPSRLPAFPARFHCGPLATNDGNFDNEDTEMANILTDFFASVFTGEDLGDIKPLAAKAYR